MGLKKTNYEVKDLGITLPIAYAVVRKLDRHGDGVYAELWIHNSRQNALNKNFLERHSVSFTIKNERENPLEAAYKEATTRHTHIEKYESDEVEIVDGVEKKVIKSVEVEDPAILDGWEDDIKVADDEKNS